MSYQGQLTLLLQNPLFKHPQENVPLSGMQQDYFAYLHQKFDEIKGCLNLLKLNCSMPLMRGKVDYLTAGVLKNQTYISNSCDCIENALALYLKGNAIDAYKTIETYLNTCPYLKTFASITQKPGSPLLKSLFKMRKNEKEPYMYSHEQMFHIPLNLRHRVATYRFSMPGVPCIYLASNLYICGLEVQATNLQNYQASRLELRNPVRVLNLAYCIREIQQLCDTWNVTHNKDLADMVISWFALYPLMLASAIKTIQKKASELLCTQGASFVPEYVIPQLLMQYVVKNEELDGIRYLSTKCISSDDHIKFYACFAFPSKTDALQGHAPNLKKLFKITDGIQLPVRAKKGTILNGDFAQTSIKNDILKKFTDYQNNPLTRPYAEAEDELWDISKHPLKIVK